MSTSQFYRETGQILPFGGSDGTESKLNGTYHPGIPTLALARVLVDAVDAAA